MPLAGIKKRLTFATRFHRSITSGLVVQLVRMPPCHGGGRGFESRPDRKSKCNPLLINELTGEFFFEGTNAGSNFGGGPQLHLTFD